jgi:alpha-L-rhamnosidase
MTRRHTLAQPPFLFVQRFYEDLAGIRPLGPGFRRIEFKPQIPITGLDSVSASYETVRGYIATRWKRTAIGLEPEVTVPPNATGRVYVPVSNPQAVTVAGRIVVVYTADSAKFIGLEGGRIIYEVGSGEYQFRIADQRTKGKQ